MKKLPLQRTRSQLLGSVAITIALLAGVGFHSRANAGEGVSAFRHVNAEKPKAEPDSSGFGPVPTHYLSLANAAPALITGINNGPVFGLPGTVGGDFWSRTQLTGDWGGLRTDLAQKGVFLDVYSTSAFQSVSGGLNPGGAFIQNVQVSLNVDTGRAGLWPGGILHVTAQARYGSQNADVFGAGTMVPTYYGSLFPGPDLDSDIYLTNLAIIQSFGDFGFLGGMIPGLNVPDQTFFGNSWRTNFANFNFNKNPMFSQFFNPQTITAMGSWSPDPSLSMALGVFDPYTDPTSLGDDAFKDVNIYAQVVKMFDVGGLPGQVLAGFNWSNQPKLNLNKPFTVTELSSTGDLSGDVRSSSVSTNYEDSSWFVEANFAQYLYVKTDPAAIPGMLGSGQTLQGIGLLGRFGYAPAETVSTTAHASLALFAHGLWDKREGDSFGVGAYYNWLSDDLKNGLSTLSAGDISIDDEYGLEAFYNLALTPAVSVNLSYQHVFNPFEAELLSDGDDADIFMVRLNANW